MMLDRRARWVAFYVLCLASLMVVLDITIVNVALPSMQSDLGISQASLAWVVNAYNLAFSGCLLLGGRLGDLYGERRLFNVGIALFTLSSLACGLAPNEGLLVAARAVQGVGGAIAMAVSLSLTMGLFSSAHDRARAMGFMGFVSAGGGSVGVILGGVLTDLLSWHWIFLVNVPVGAVVLLLSLRLIPSVRGAAHGDRLDIAGAITVTGSLVLLTYAIVNGPSAGWGSAETLTLLALSIAGLAAFVWIEARVASPLMPLRLFRLRNLSAANAASLLWSAGDMASFFILALYLQLVLAYTPLQVGLAFLPSNILMAVCSLWLSARAVMRFGIRVPLVLSSVFSVAGLLVFVDAPAHGGFYSHVLLGTGLLGLGFGLGMGPQFLAALSGVPPQDMGLASGLVNTTPVIGGALGIALMAAISTSRTATLLANGVAPKEALLGGYHLAFFAGAIFVLLTIPIIFLMSRRLPAESEQRDFGELEPAVSAPRPRAGRV
jgi:EmrB/QacA subfamily drug resistance transporter